MEMKALIENLIREFSSAFLEYKQQKNDLDISDRIYCNFWKYDMLKALNGHDFENVPLSAQSLANWFLRYGYALCEGETRGNVRDSLKMCNILRFFPPRGLLMCSLEHKTPRRHLYGICDALSPKTASFKLDSNNFIEHFQLLLEVEDVESLLDYLRLVQRDVTLIKCRYMPFRYRAKIKNDLNGRSAPEVVSPKVDEVIIVPKCVSFDTSLIANCIKVLISNEIKTPKLFVASVENISETELIFEIDPKDKLSNPVDLIFRPTRYPLRYQYRSLTLLAKNEGMRKFLFPEVERKIMQITDCNNNVCLIKQRLINKKIFNNPEQLAAISQITSGRISSKAPFIIFGPPGTGKTTTIVESILQLRLQYPESRILVTAGSNSACDTIALRICEYFKSSQSLKNYLENATALPLLRIYSRSIVDRGLQNVPFELRKQSNIEWLNGEHAYPAVEDIHRYGIIVATLCTVGKLVCGNVSSENFFTHVFIDEAGAASEPETLVGIVGIKNEISDRCHIILSGDHKQLGPVIKSDYAAKHGLGKSLMQRLLERDCYAVRNGAYDRSLQIRLRRNYRSHPEIVGLYNRLYYRRELIAMVTEKESKSKWSFLRNPNFPIAFHAVCGEVSKSGTTSSCNMLEVQILISYISRLLKADGVDQNDIGVITPYKLQSERIKCRLDERKWYEVEVGSVEYFQGREKPIIIASMVRSKNGLGFVKNRKRLNVLLSRPKILLLILGEPATLSDFYDMKCIIETCKMRGNYFDETNNTFGQVTIDSVAKQKLKRKKKPKSKQKSKKNATRNVLLKSTSNLTKADTATNISIKPMTKKEKNVRKTKNKRSTKSTKKVKRIEK